MRGGRGRTRATCFSFLMVAAVRRIHEESRDDGRRRGGQQTNEGGRNIVKAEERPTNNEPHNDKQRDCKDNESNSPT